jgi:hypothetical protein
MGVPLLLDYEKFGMEHGFIEGSVSWKELGNEPDGQCTLEHGGVWCFLGFVETCRTACSFAPQTIPWLWMYITD